MSKQEDTLNKAYGNMPKEVGLNINWNDIPALRGVKYYWYKLIRKLQGRSRTDCDCGHSH
jgi:hypothetical protein